MAELAKKINIKKNDTIQTAKIYTTVAETGSTVTMPIKVDGVQGYVGLVDTTNTLTTSLRVKKAGVVYAAPSTGKPPYTEMDFTTPSTYTFTVPAGVTRMRVACCGGGGGSGAIGVKYDSWPAVGSHGTASSFGNLIKATGGEGQWAITREKVSPDHGSYYYHFGYNTPAGGSPGYTGNGFSLSFISTPGSYGQCGRTSYLSTKYCTGRAGGFASAYIDVQELQSYIITVGGGGISTTGGKTNQVVEYYAGNGFVKIAFGGDL